MKEIKTNVKSLNDVFEFYLEKMDYLCCNLC